MQLSLRMWMTSSARVRGLRTPSAYCGPTVWRRQLCSRCSVRSSSLSSLTPLRRSGALRPPPTDSVSILFCVELFGLTCGHRLGSLTRIRSRTSATQLMMNCSPKSELPPNKILHALLPPPSTLSQNYSVSKNVPPLQLATIFTYTIFGTNVAEKASNKNILYFPTTPI